MTLHNLRPFSLVFVAFSCNDQNNTASYIVAGLIRLQDEKCSKPYACDLNYGTSVDSLCLKASDESPSQFFGRAPVNFKVLKALKALSFRSSTQQRRASTHSG